MQLKSITLPVPETLERNLERHRRGIALAIGVEQRKKRDPLASLAQLLRHGISDQPPERRPREVVRSFRLECPHLRHILLSDFLHTRGQGSLSIQSGGFNAVERLVARE